jgi:hypothetical protein
LSWAKLTSSCRHIKLIYPRGVFSRNLPRQIRRQRIDELARQRKALWLPFVEELPVSSEDRIL